MATSSPRPAPRSADPALAAYEALAPYYDDFTDGYAHDPWLAAIERLAAEHGVHGGRALDLACGTGKSAVPLQRRGWHVTACDLSPGMVAAARRRLGTGPARCFVADMRDLPELDPFDLVLCLDDSVNYLLGAGDLEAALHSCARVLGPRGVAVFDVNTLRTYATVFGSTFGRTGTRGTYRWCGRGTGRAEPGATFTADVEVRTPGGELVRSTHVQRHHSPAAVARAARRAGLEVAACRGQSEGGVLGPAADDRTHLKLVYALRRPRSPEEVIA